MGSISLAALSNHELLAQTARLVSAERHAAVELIALLAEVDSRELYLGEGFPSLFAYCTQALHLSESAAYDRITAARTSREFPIVLERLVSGAITLTTVRLLKPHLTAGNCERCLDAASHKTKREVELLVATLAPQPDVAPSICKLPAPKAAIPVAPAPVVPNDDLRKTAISPSEACPPGPIAAILAPAAHRPAIAPLAPERYRVQFTIDQETEEQLRRLQDLLRREIPDGDPGAIFVRALPLLLREVERKKFAATASPRPGRSTKPGSRHVPAAVEREVWQRDGGQCAFVAKGGHRCTERSFLEFHHANEPYALGGEATAENMALRCRAHNVYEAELIFGPDDPARVREAPAGYGNSSNCWSPEVCGRSISKWESAPMPRYLPKRRSCLRSAWAPTWASTPNPPGTTPNRKSCWLSIAVARSKAQPLATTSTCEIWRAAAHCCWARPRTTTGPVRSVPSCACLTAPTASKTSGAALSLLKCTEKMVSS